MAALLVAAVAAAASASANNLLRFDGEVNVGECLSINEYCEKYWANQKRVSNLSCHFLLLWPMQFPAAMLQLFCDQDVNQSSLVTILIRAQTAHCTAAFEFSSLLKKSSFSTNGPGGRDQLFPYLRRARPQRQTICAAQLLLLLVPQDLTLGEEPHS